MTSKTKAIKKRLVEFELEYPALMNKRYSEAQAKLKNLVLKHGIENVALASGLRVTTINQYINLKIAPAINSETVLKAETILEGL